MKAMLLAAGLGTRLRPLTDSIPKPLIPVNGIPLIFYNLALLKKHGITDVVINLHYLGDQIQNTLGDGKKFGFRFEYSHEPQILGTGGGIKAATPFLKGCDDFLVLNSDIIIDIDLKELIARHRSYNVPVTLVVQESPLASQLGILQVDDSHVLSILDEPQINKTPNMKDTFFTGVHIISKSFLDWTYPHTKACVIREGYIPLLKQGTPLGAYLYDGFWSDLGTIQSLNETVKEISSGKISLSFQKELTELVGC